MNIIFLDIDGVLNGYNQWNTLGWKLILKFKSKRLRSLYRRLTDPCGVHESKVKRLAKIVKASDAKVVMSSSWRFGWWKTPYEDMYDDQRKLTDLLNKYNIEVIDITPDLACGKRDEEILQWLSEHENEMHNFIILDDENTFMRAFWNDVRFIQTSSVPKGVMVQGFGIEDAGLKNKHVKRAINVLARKETVYD